MKEINFNFRAENITLDMNGHHQIIAELLRAISSPSFDETIILAYDLNLRVTPYDHQRDSKNSTFEYNGQPVEVRNGPYATPPKALHPVTRFLETWIVTDKSSESFDANEFSMRIVTPMMDLILKHYPKPLIRTLMISQDDQSLDDVLNQELDILYLTINTMLELLAIPFQIKYSEKKDTFKLKRNKIKYEE